MGMFIKKGDLKLKSSTIVEKKIVEEIKNLPIPQQKKILEGSSKAIKDWDRSHT